MLAKLRFIKIDGLKRSSNSILQYGSVLRCLQVTSKKTAFFQIAFVSYKQQRWLTVDKLRNPVLVRIFSKNLTEY